MKASKILAGLSALSIAASMLSMVAAADDEVAGTAPTSTDDGASYNIAGEDPDPEGGVVEEEADTTGTADDAEFKFGGKTYPGIKSGAGYWTGYKAASPFAAKGPFIGWPGWGVTSFPTYWELYEDYLTYRDSAWEVWGTKQNNTVPGYLVFEFEDGKKYVIPMTVDKNGQVETKEIPIFRQNIDKIYLLFEVSDAPNFDVALDAVNVNGKDIAIEKDYLKGKDVLRDSNGNPVTDVNGNYIADPFKGTYPNGDDKYTTADFTEDDPTFFQATLYDKYSLKADDFDSDYKFDDKKPLSPTNHDETPINHKVFFFGTKVKIKFTVSGIGVEKEAVHVDQKKKDGDQKGETHTHVEPDVGGLKGVTDEQYKNLNLDYINPHFTEYTDANGRTYCSRDLYDSLVEVYNSDPDHKTDAEIKFKTVSDKNGTLVANFLNVWELDTDSDGNTAHWAKKFQKVYENELRDENGNLRTDTENKIIDSVALYLKKKEVKWMETPKVVKEYDIACGEFKQYNKPYAETEEEKDPEFEKDETTGLYKYKTIKGKQDGETKYWVFDKDIDGNYDFTRRPTYRTLGDKVEVDGKPQEKKADKWVYDFRDEKDKLGNFLDPRAKFNGIVAKKDDKFVYWVDDNGKIVNVELEQAGDEYKDENVEEAYCWHPYFMTENGLVDIVTKNYLGNYKTNVPEYTWLTDKQIKNLSDNNGMYYNDNIHSAAYGHFVVFGDNTLREYSYRIKADAVKSMLEVVQRSNVARDDFVCRHGGDDIEGFNKDWESMDPQYLDYHAKNDYPNATPDNKTYFEHHRAVHGAIWLQVCDGNYITDVKVHAHTDILKHDDLPKLYGKETYEAMYPTVSSSTASSSAAPATQPTAAAEETTPNAESGAAAGFGIAGLLLAGAAMVCAKKKS